MSETTTVVVDAPGDGDDAQTGAAFAAGAAAAISQQAAADAADAEAEAEQAQETAEHAAETANAAATASAVTLDQLAELRAELTTGMDELREMFASASAPPAAADTVPAPELIDAPADDSPADDTPPNRHGDDDGGDKRYGARRWFGS